MVAKERNESEIVREINARIEDKQMMAAVGTEVYQMPHNYAPSADCMSKLKARVFSDLSLKKIKGYEKKYGTSCNYEEQGKRCTLPVEEHKMCLGLILLVHPNLSPQHIIDYIEKFKDLLEKYNIDGISKIYFNANNRIS